MRSCVLAMALLGCTGAREAGQDDELDGAKAQVRRFFDALAKRDCPTLASLLPAAAEPATCAKLLHEWNDDLRIKLVDLPAAERDGRDRHAIIVRASVMRHDAPTMMLVRVIHEQDKWRLVL